MRLSKIARMFELMSNDDIIEADKLALKMMTNPNEEFRNEDLVFELTMRNADLSFVDSIRLAELLEQRNSYGAFAFNRDRAEAKAKADAEAQKTLVGRIKLKLVEFWDSIKPPFDLF